MTAMTSAAHIVFARARARGDRRSRRASHAGVRRACAREWRSSYGWLLDRDGVVLEADRARLRRPASATWVALDDVSPALAIARSSASRTSASTSTRGVDWRALARRRMADAARATGAAARSTITMQLAGLRRSPKRARRAVAAALGVRSGRRCARAWRIERRWSKAQILEAYLNRVSVRGELQGVARGVAASLFGKAPSGLTRRRVLAARKPDRRAERRARGARRARACALAARRGRGSRTAPSSTALARNSRSTRPQSRRPLPSLAPQLARQLLREPGERVVTTLVARPCSAARATCLRVSSRSLARAQRRATARRSWSTTRRARCWRMSARPGGTRRALRRRRRARAASGGLDAETVPVRARLRATAT